MLKRLADWFRRFGDSFQSSRGTRKAREDEVEKEGPFAGRPMP
jgi:hypothetical protein